MFHQGNVSPSPQFQRWARHHPRSSPRGQKFGETELSLRATPTLKLGGGESATPQFHQRTYRSSPNNSVLFLSPNFVLLPDGPSPSSPKNRNGAGPRGQLRCRQHRATCASVTVTILAAITASASKGCLSSLCLARSLDLWRPPLTTSGPRPTKTASAATKAHVGLAGG